MLGKYSGWQVIQIHRISVGTGVWGSCLAVFNQLCDWRNRKGRKARSEKKESWSLRLHWALIPSLGYGGRLDDRRLDHRRLDDLCFDPFASISGRRRKGGGILLYLCLIAGWIGNSKRIPTVVGIRQVGAVRLSRTHLERGIVDLMQNEFYEYAGNIIVESN